MDLPTPREIELETALRQRDAQVAELTVRDLMPLHKAFSCINLVSSCVDGLFLNLAQNQMSRLRQYLAVQPQPTTTDSITLPPPLVSVLLPHINKPASAGSSNTSTNSSTVNAALTQRVRLLQEENDELYEMLKHGETGKLKEEVRGLRRVVDRLESALRESHQVITALSTELDKSYQSFQSSLRQKQVNSHVYPPPPRDALHHPSQAPSASNGLSKVPPTGPRARKKPRLSDVKTSPAQSNVSLPPSKAQGPVKREPSRSPRMSPVEIRGKGHVKMELDEDARTRPRSSQERDRERHRDKERVRDRERDRDRDRERERERDRMSRRNGAGGGGGGGGGGARRSRGFGHPYAGVDRTLAERMGL
ncbi:hypothetical protein F5I97DRAFT_1926070 [Phlebopus sp. FC_14]|nr:hypothetical protein F5I97DRAFT_1926070 [Phlebopus sp. FC_14]